MYTGTPQWEKCLATCREISVGGRFNLLPDYFENFDPNNHIAATEEIIFYNIFNVSAVPTGIQMNLQSRSLHLAHFGIVDRVQSPFLAVPPDFYNSFQHGEDKRANAFIIGPQFSDFDTTDGTPLEDTQGEQINYTLDIPGFPIAEESSGVRVLKYQLDPSSNGLDANNDFAIFRLSDIILMEAEALNELGDGPGAIELINRVRNRGFASSGADIEDTGFNQTSLRDQILLERGHELFWEGFRRQDLIRHGKFCEERLYKPVDDDCEKRKLFPIPQAVIDVNDAIVQNPGY